jgi:hypothetical protein
MGTRNLTMVISGKKVKVAQYGQWDGYPSGQGITALNFLRNTTITDFKEKLERAKFIDDAKQAEIDAWLKSIGSKNGGLNLQQAEKYKKRYPFLSRDHGAGVLNLIMESENEIIWLDDASDFAADSLFCEWGYVIDLDKRTFEVYKGFQKKPLGKSQRFYNLSEPNMDYYPIRMVKKYSLDALPSEDEFLSYFEKKQ